MQNSPIYLIPFDFTPVSKGALRLGLDLAEANNGSVYVLHIVKKANEKKDIRKKFDEIREGLTDEESKRTLTKVVVGDLYEDVGKAGDILNADLIVMGTHGAQGMQKVFGSHAVRLISSSATPFLITQGKKSVDKIKTIVMPFSFAKESIQITTFAGEIAKKFNAKIHLCGYHDKDSWLGAKTKANLAVVRGAFNEIGVEHEIVNIPPGKSYNDELLEYASSVDADIIAAAHFKEGILPAPNTFIQGMIENEKQIPVLTVNADELYGATYSFNPF